jgi:hypothetical protein
LLLLCPIPVLIPPIAILLLHAIAILVPPIPILLLCTIPVLLIAISALLPGFPAAGLMSMENPRKFGRTPYLGVQWKLHLAGLHQRVVATFLRLQ